jgi:hypothetical protein
MAMLAWHTMEDSIKYSALAARYIFSQMGLVVYAPIQLRVYHHR